MPDDNNAHNLDSASSTSVAERPVESPEGSTLNSDSPQPPQSAHTDSRHNDSTHNDSTHNDANQNLDEKQPSTTEDFASALESFTTESEEAARGFSWSSGCGR